MRDVRAFEVERLEERVLLTVSVIAQLPHGWLPDERFVAGDAMYFVLAPEAGDQEQLWKTDGRASGTAPILDATTRTPATFDDDAKFFPAGERVFVIAYARLETKLWVIDQASGTSRFLRSFSVDERDQGGLAVVMDGVLYFSASGDSKGYELWRSDGTLSGTRLVKDINSFDSSFPSSLVGVNHTLYFCASSVHGEVFTGNRAGLYRSDGTAKGTINIWEPDPVEIDNDQAFFPVIPRMVASGGGVFFLDSRDGLWFSDGMFGGTHRVGSNGVAELHIATPDNQGVFVVALDETYGFEPWAADLTGFRLLKDISPGRASSYPLVDVTIGGKSYLTAGGKTYSTDGTPEGTQLFDTGFGEIQPVGLDGHLFVIGFRSESDNSFTLFHTDGTLAGTRPVTTAIVSDPVTLLNHTLMFFHATSSNDSDFELMRFEPGGSISGRIFNDANHNGSKDSSESGLSGWRVYVDLNNDGVPNRNEPAVRTSSSGFYQIDDLPAGKYTVRQTRISGYAATTNESYRVTVEALGNVTKKFGNAIAGTVRGYVFNDANHNGVRDSGEAGLFNFRVFIDLDNDGVLDLNEPTAHTNSAGRYEIADVLPGDYRIRLKPRGGYASTTQKSFGFSLSAGGTSSKRFGVALI